MQKKGKEYDNKGKLIFEGEYLCGKNFNGKGYNEQGNAKYEKLMEMINLWIIIYILW